MADLATPDPDHREEVRFDYRKDVRFAVVMYGGVSLAIYINGVAQELLRMVKSTAPSPDAQSHRESQGVARALPRNKDGEPCGTEKIYRKLSYLVDDPDHRRTFRQTLRKGREFAARWQPSKTDIRVRFMVDVLAGTSAGGINSIYLAKALANDQNIDDLKNLWVSEGDIHVLLNDSASLQGTSLGRQKPPQSLLNSRRMYLKLLDALDAMDAKDKENPPRDVGVCLEGKVWANGERKRSRLVDELDLYITATDIRGLALPIRLADGVVYERRHKNVFHFKYMTPDATGINVNEFEKKLNPFLAFAARTTSSFPFAFEPVRLADIRDLLEHSEEHRAEKDKFEPKSDLLRKFFQNNLTHDVDFGLVNYDLRSFADGGYLDNKPFSHATNALTRRTPYVPVDRKLIYIEPAPEHPERQVQPNEPPDAIQNVMAALDLPRYETIREDIQAVLKRNRLIERVNSLASEIEGDIETYNDRTQKQKQPKLSEATLRVVETLPEDSRKEILARLVPEIELSTPTQAVLETLPKEIQLKFLKQLRPEAQPSVPWQLWDTLLMPDMAALLGIHYLPYRRLRISALTDEIAKLTAAIRGFDEESDLFTAVRALVRTWRKQTYGDASDSQELQGGLTLNHFLNKFDLAYRMRRLNFLVGKIDELLGVINYLCRVEEDQLKTDGESGSRVIEEDRLQSEQKSASQLSEDELWSHRLEKSKKLREFVRKVERHQPAKTFNSEDFDFWRWTVRNPAYAVSALLYLKRELNQQFVKLRSFGRDLRRRSDHAPDSSAQPLGSSTREYRSKIEEYRNKVGALGITEEHLKLILGERINGNNLDINDQFSIECLHYDDVTQRAEALWNESANPASFLNKNPDPARNLTDLQKKFRDAADYLQALINSVLTPVGARTRQLLNLDQKGAEPKPGESSSPKVDDDPSRPNASSLGENRPSRPLADAEHLDTPFALTVRAYLGWYFDHFDDYDQVSFPIYFETEAGESDIIEVIRISPEDAPSLINEKNDARRRTKLAGTKLGNFSAFLDGAWRVNDIMWGRLDGAERLIKAMLPDEKDRDIRDALTREAHETILAEELSPAAQADLAVLLGEALVRRKAGLSVSDAIDRIIKPVDDELVKQRLTNVMTTCLQGHELYAFMRDYYEVNRKFEPEPTLKVLGRATRVIGGMLDDISKKHNAENKATRWVSRVGQIFLGLVEVSVPDSLVSLLFRHTLKLLYFFEVVLLLAATFLISTPEVTNFAWKLLLLTVAVHFAIFVLRDYIRGKRFWRWLPLYVLAIVVVLLAVIGGGDLLRQNWSGKVLAAWQVVANFWASARAWVAQLF